MRDIAPPIIILINFLEVRSCFVGKKSYFAHKAHSLWLGGIPESPMVPERRMLLSIDEPDAFALNELLKLSK